MHQSFELFRKVFLYYCQLSRDFSREWGIPQTSFDILMFLGNNPEYNTARDIVEVRGLKANLVSIHLERLEQEGYLTRGAVAGDRRKRSLQLTEKAQPILRAGQQMQQQFLDALGKDVTDEQKQTINRALDIMRRNLNTLLEEH